MMILLAPIHSSAAAATGAEAEEETARVQLMREARQERGLRKEEEDGEEGLSFVLREEWSTRGSDFIELELLSLSFWN